MKVNLRISAAENIEMIRQKHFEVIKTTVSCTGYRVQGTGYLVQGTGYRVQGILYRVRLFENI